MTERGSSAAFAARAFSRAFTRAFTRAFPQAVACALALSISLAGSGAAQAGDAAVGRQKAQMCQTCHGIDGVAKIPSAPHIAGESEVYLVTQLKAFRSGQRTHEIMSLIAAQLSDEDIDNLAAWYSSIEIEVRVPE
jgi:cytochrome c553